MGVLMNLRLIVVVLGLMVMLGAVGAYQNTEVQEDPGLSKPPSLEVHDVNGDHPTPVTDAILGSYFMENRGQLRDDEVLYYATTPGLHVAFHSNGLSYTLTEQVAENAPTSDDGPGNGWRLHLMFLGSQEVVPVPGSTWITAPWICGRPRATWNCVGSLVTKRPMACSLRTPMTESVAPHIPRSVRYPVPPGSTSASAVGMWVWVPTTALTRPSR